MRLSKVKLAGFKSFVDPTVISFPSNLVGVVGPNGCGKSNVIDAVRWVMGESSASRLRGDSITDVIFKGSSSRKPVGAAAVELIFDNTATTIEGEYAKYNEISIRRVVSRDGISNYYLNGVRCRRKDITGIFLGTGLGPRSYSIIEQGMISRMIEAKPEEMRVFIEEAAGISKYKERRKETSSRIIRTKDNLDRLLDVIDEVDKQINHLNRQAKTAERYKTMKHEERRLSADILAIRIRDLNDDAIEIEKVFAEKKLLLDSKVAEQRKIEAELESYRLEQNEKSDNFNKAQANYYKVGSEISRLEQSIEYSTEIESRQKNDLEQAIKNAEEIEDHISLDQEQITDIDSMLSKLKPNIDDATQTEQMAKESLLASEQNIKKWQNEWEDLQIKKNAFSQNISIESTRLADAESALIIINAKVNKIKSDASADELNEIEHQIKKLIVINDNNRENRVTLENSLSSINENILKLRQKNNSMTASSESESKALRDKESELFRLNALQDAAYGNSEGQSIKWLEKSGLSKNKRIAQNLNVANGWEIAVETVLGDYLEGLCMNSMQQAIDTVKDFKEGRVTLIDNKCSSNNGDFNPETLASKVENAPDAIYLLLENVFVANSLDHATEIVEHSAKNISAITSKGVWLGKDWLRLFHEKSKNESSFISREKSIRMLEKEIKELIFNNNRAEDELIQIRKKLDETETQKDKLQDQITESINIYLKSKDELNTYRNQRDQLKILKSNSNNEISSLESEKKNLNKIILSSKSELEAASKSLDQLELLSSNLEIEKSKLDTELARVRDQYEVDRTNAQNMIIQYESNKSSKQSAAQNLERMITQKNHFESRKNDIQEQIQLNRQPLLDNKNLLEDQLSEKIKAESELNKARKILEKIEHELTSMDQQRLKTERSVQEANEDLSQSKEELQIIKIRREGLDEQIQQTQFEYITLIEEMQEASSLSLFEENLEKVTAKINRLGPINLAAIDELKINEERKEYLDSQLNDLNNALSTLEGAIRKIDRETKSRFRETFNKVNLGFEKLFPRLFGGGRAYMELIGDDLLSAGVTVMARPPGKRNSTINLLSGGEKALTAVALVFAIFELNPSPFCMLDEVDAPLDDTNVNRFCEIVKDMSEKVQFIFITHNKATMELARQLSGVTMQEPGVSRLVSVDLDEAMKMTAD